MTSPFTLAAILHDRIAIVGTAGSGKTYASKGLVEQLVPEGARLCIVDALGVWWGLRAPGGGDGLAVLILGGAHGDLPLEEHDGEAVAAAIADGHLQCVVDLSELPSGAARRRFMTAFLGTLRERNREPLHLVLDEADLWAPQRPGPESLRLLGEVDEIVRRGRVRGFVPWLITQRPAVLSKDVLSQADVLIAMKLTSAQDRAAIGAWIEGQADRAQEKALLAALPKLARGEGFVWAPGLDVLERVAFPPIATFDSSATPDRRRRAAGPTSLVSVESAVASLRARLSHEGLTPVFGPLGGTVGAAPWQDGFEAGKVYGYENGYLDGRAEALDRACAALSRVHEVARVVRGELDDYRVIAPPEAPPPGEAERARPLPSSVKARQPNKGAAAASVAPPTNNPGTADLASGATHLLQVLAARHPAPLSEAQWATLARRARRGGTWAAHRRTLQQAGLIQLKDRRFTVTADGLAAAGVVAARPQTVAELLADWKRALGSGPSRLLDALLAHPEGLDRQQLAVLVQMSAAGGTFNAHLRALMGNELVIPGRGKRVRVAAILLGTES